MSEVKTVKLGTKTVTVRELTVAEIMSLVSDNGEENPGQVLTTLLQTCTSAKVEDLLPLAPSAIDPLIEAMLEVNKSFFAQNRAIGMLQTAEGLERMIKSVSVLPFMA